LIVKTFRASSSSPRRISTRQAISCPSARRLELLRFAETAGASIIEDDYDGEFHYEARPVAALQGLAQYGRVFYLGTFSKSMFADIRVGYIIVPEDLVSTFEFAQRHLGLVVTIAMQAALAEFIGTGSYLAHVRRTTRLYRARRDRLSQALAAEAGDRLAIDVPAGGMQLLAHCRTSTNDTRSLQHYLGHKNIQHTVRYSELSPERFRDFWKD
jgi:GntR family transcriptional regulator/MocR family aminotransferase